MIKKICFVCAGNIVRSPLAENIFIYLADKAGVLTLFEVSSAGTGAWHVGDPPDGRMRRVAARHGLKYNGTACQFHRKEFDEHDLIIVMDLENKDDLMRLARTSEQKVKIHLLREFDPLVSTDAAVPDPYYGSIYDFEDVYQIIERSVKGLLSALTDGQINNLEEP